MSMTTELAQRMKAAAEKLDGDSWHDEGASVYGGAYDVGDTVCYDHIVDCESVNGESLVAEFIALANPANVLALVEALEARDKQIAEDVQIKARLCRESNSLFDRLRAAENRIAELEFAQSLHDEGTGMLCGQYDELAAAMGWTSELAEKQGMSQLEYAYGLKRRIEELEARTVKLPPTFWYEHDDLSRDIPVLDKRLVKKAIRAAGVAVEGE